MVNESAYNRHRPALIFWLGLGFAYSFGFVFAMFPTEGDWGMFFHPLVLFFISFVVITAAVITYPFLYFAIRERSLTAAVLIILGVTHAAILLLALLVPGYCFYGTFVAYFIAMWLAWKFSPPLIKPGFCPKCAYCLRGLSHDCVCPECGYAIPNSWPREMPGCWDEKRVAQLREKPSSNQLDMNIQSKAE